MALCPKVRYEMIMFHLGDEFRFCLGADDRQTFPTGRDPVQFAVYYPVAGNCNLWCNSMATQVTL